MPKHITAGRWCCLKLFSFLIPLPKTRDQVWSDEPILGHC